MPASHLICLVAIVKDENRFLDEWLVYHRMIGINHFFIYDDDSSLPLKEFLSPHSDYLTVIEWWDQINNVPQRKGTQITAYNHALKNHISAFEWVVFLDVDEFVVLRKHSTIKEFLLDYKDVSSISLNWYQFGHNGFFHDPRRLITSSLNRRMRSPHLEVKTITKTDAVLQITNPHFCELKYGDRVDANHKLFKEELYDGKAKVAGVNHYLSRSFKTWMRRVDRGDVNFTVKSKDAYSRWRLSEQQCLERFVSLISREYNEYLDDFMLQFRYDILERINKLNRNVPYTIVKEFSNDEDFATIKTKLSFIFENLISHANCSNNVGLFNGKAGIAVFLFHYSKFTGNQQCLTLALKLLDNIADEITEASPLNFNDGIAGFGMAIEHLVAESFIKIDSDELLEDIDILLHYHIVKGATPEYELIRNMLDFGYYYISRFNNPINSSYSKRESQNRLLLELISDKVSTLYDLRSNRLDYLDFLLKLYLHSENRDLTMELIQQELAVLEDVVYNGEFLYQWFNPLYATEILLEFSRNVEDKSISDLAICIINNHENDYWQYINKNLSMEQSIEMGLRYLHLAKLLNNEAYIKKGINCLMPFFNNEYILAEWSLKQNIVYGLILLTIIGDWSDRLFNMAIIFAIEANKKI